MGEIKRISQPAMALRAGRSFSPFDSTRRKLIAYVLAMLMVVTMVIWIGGLAWGLLTLAHWGLDRLHFLSALF
jgi:hypothetical protein